VKPGSRIPSTPGGHLALEILCLIFFQALPSPEASLVRDDTNADPHQIAKKAIT